MSYDDDTASNAREIVLERLRYALDDLCVVLFDEDSLNEVEEIVHIVLQNVLRERGAK